MPRVNVLPGPATSIVVKGASVAVEQAVVGKAIVLIIPNDLTGIVDASKHDFASFRDIDGGEGVGRGLRRRGRRDNERERGADQSEGPVSFSPHLLRYSARIASAYA